MNEIQKAKKAHEAAAKKLMRVVKQTYPIGMVITVTMGRSRFDAEVIGHNNWCWWHEPGRLQVRNLKTGKTRHFTADSEHHDIQIIG